MGKLRTFGVIMIAMTILGMVQPAFGAPVTISGTLTNSSVYVDRLFGAEGDRYEIGLNFYAQGPVTYDYSFTFDAGLSYYAGTSTTAGVFSPGSTHTLRPTLSLTSANLTATQSLQFGTSFVFSVDPPGPGSVNETFELPDYISSSLELGGDRTLNTSGNQLIPTTAAVTTSPGETDAWWAGADLVTIAANLGVPGMAFWDDAGGDLILSMSMDILRQDMVQIIQSPLDLVTLTVPSDGILGDPFSFGITDTVTYDVLAESNFYYEAALALVFDLFDFYGWGTSRVDLFDIPLATWYEGSVSIQTTAQSLVTFSSQDYVIGGDTPVYCSINSDGERICLAETYSSSYRPRYPLEGYNLERLFGSIPAGGPVISTADVIFYPVPEPSSLLLLGSGLAGLAWFDRRRKRVVN